MVVSKNSSSPHALETPSTAFGLDTLNIGALIYRLDADVPLLVDANETAKRQLHLSGRFPMADPWQWLDARQNPAGGLGHPARLEMEDEHASQWHCFHIRQHRQPLKALKLKVSPLLMPGAASGTRFALIAVGEIEVVSDAAMLGPQSLPHLHQMIDNLPMAACIVDIDGFLRVINSAFREFFGYAEHELLNAHFRKLLPARQREAAEVRHTASFIQSLPPRRAVEVELCDGSARTVLIEDTMSEDDDGRRYRLVFMVDITERRNVERRLEEKNRRLEYLATRDALTGLHNRRFGLELLEQAVERSWRYGEKVAVVMLDLDHFKAINDQYGHHVGDVVLTEFSRFAAAELRSSDTLVRWGGEEFLMILPGTDRFAAQSTVGRILSRLESLTLTSSALRVSFSAGIGEHCRQTPQDFLKEIDRALYQAKSAGRGCVSIAPISFAHPDSCVDPALSSP